MESDVTVALKIQCLQIWLHGGYVETLDSLMQQPAGVLPILLHTLEARIRKDGYVLEWGSDGYLGVCFEAAI